MPAPASAAKNRRRRASPWRQCAALIATSALLAVAAARWHPAGPLWQPRESETGAFSRYTLPLHVARTNQRFSHALWIDARSAEAFARGHLPGAMPLTEADWENQFAALVDAWTPERPIIVYCDSPACGTAASVAARLRRDLGSEEVYAVHEGWEGLAR